MVSFTELLTADDAGLVKIFYKIKSNPADDFIIRINKVATQLDLNHSQLVCALGFNRYIRDLSDIYSQIGFRSYKLLAYRCNELFSTDTYNQLPVDNILDIYSERHEDQQILESLRQMLGPRLEHIENDIDKNEDPSHIISYRMEIHSVYTAGIMDKVLAEKRLNKDIGRFRHMANETAAMIEAEFFPPSNLFFHNMVSMQEKRHLIEQKHITKGMIANRLQNTHISTEEREMLEEYL